MTLASSVTPNRAAFLDGFLSMFAEPQLRAHREDAGRVVMGSLGMGIVAGPQHATDADRRALAGAELYVADYNLYLHHALSPDGERLFPAGKRLEGCFPKRKTLRRCPRFAL